MLCIRERQNMQVCDQLEGKHRLVLVNIFIPPIVLGWKLTHNISLNTHGQLLHSSAELHLEISFKIFYPLSLHSFLIQIAYWKRLDDAQ